MTSRMREIYFHEDDYCQQQLLPHEAASFADDEVKRIDEFADAHQAPDGTGWTDIYRRQEALKTFRSLNISKEVFAAALAPFLPPFDVVQTGYSSHREQCTRTAAWGRSQECAVFADWDEDGIVANVWSAFFENSAESVLAAALAVAAIGQIRPLVYADWAWGYTCDATNQEIFVSKLKAKLDAIAARAAEFRQC